MDSPTVGIILRDNVTGYPLRTRPGTPALLRSVHDLAFVPAEVTSGSRIVCHRRFTPYIVPQDSCVLPWSAFRSAVNSVFHVQDGRLECTVPRSALPADFPFSGAGGERLVLPADWESGLDMDDADLNLNLDIDRDSYRDVDGQWPFRLYTSGFSSPAATMPDTGGDYVNPYVYIGYGYDARGTLTVSNRQFTFSIDSFDAGLTASGIYRPFGASQLEWTDFTAYLGTAPGEPQISASLPSGASFRVFGPPDMYSGWPPSDPDEFPRAGKDYLEITVSGSPVPGTARFTVAVEGENGSPV